MNFSDTIIRWGKQHGRSGLPWQQDISPYSVWISEIMLQQTRVETVIPYYQKFMGRYPSVHKLAGAELDEVLSLWSGLGYYRRAHHLHQAAQQVLNQFGGEFPSQRELLEDLPGIGRSTAAAILSLANNQPEPILDGNVKRVFCRYFGVTQWPGKSTVLKQLWTLAEKHMPGLHARLYNQTLMDLGAGLCSHSKPACEHCPLHGTCHAQRTDSQHLIPAPKPRKPLPRRQARFLLIINQEDEIFLQQRPPTGIWPQLWCLPELPEQEGNIDKYLQKNYGFGLVHTQELPALLHTFSHFQLEIQPLRLHVKKLKTAQVLEADSGVWYKASNFEELGLPSPIRRLLRRHLTPQ